MSRLAVVGAGGHARVVIAAARAEWSEIAVFDDASDPGSPIGPSNMTVRGAVEAAGDWGDAVVLAKGDNGIRAELAATLEGVTWATIVHPRAFVEESAAIGPGTVVFAGAVVQADATIGHHAIVNTSASVDHDARVGDFTHIAPGARLTGAVRIGQGVLVGVAAAIVPGVSVGDWATVAAGAVVTKDVDASQTVAGIPAGPI